jgi:hypothetical protein
VTEPEEGGPVSPEDEFYDFLHGIEGQEPSGEEEPDPVVVVRSQCDQWVQATQAVRFENREGLFPGPLASPAHVKDGLVLVRARLDQMETMLGNVIALKAASAEAATRAEQRAEDAWDVQAEAEQRRPRPEYQGSRERYAFWNLATRDERAAAREARALANYVRGAYDVIKLHYEGLNETRRDLVSRLSHFRWESSMEQ